MRVRLISAEEILLVGLNARSSISNNKTKELWSTFKPRLNEIKDRWGIEYYSVEVYDNLDYFQTFNPTKSFEKWATVRVSKGVSIPENMKPLTIPSGDYAVFDYKGKPSEAFKTYQYIYGEWINNSGYSLDNRPHFALMGEKYLGENDASEEELWIPIKKLPIRLSGN